MSQPTAFDVEPEPPSDNCREPGVHHGVPFSEYHEWDAINHSRLPLIDKSPLHCFVGRSYGETDAMRFGSLVHCGKLEPDSIAARYMVMPDYANHPDNVTSKGEKPLSLAATSWYKNKKAMFEEVARQLGKLVVTQPLYDNLQLSLAAMLTETRITDAVNRGRSEVSIVWHDRHTGIRCKARIDSVSDILIDLKTHEDASRPTPLPISFEWSMAQRNYYTQAAWYQSGWEAVTGQRLPFWFCVVSTTPPIQCVAAPVMERSLRKGRKVNARRMELYARCKRSGVWPGYESPEGFELPEKYFDDEDE